jgi:predicted membrane GTPase involved in stress response
MDQEPKVRDGRWWKITSSVQYVPDEEIFEDTKGVIRIRKWNKDRQHSDRKKKIKRTNNDLPNITHKTKIE